MTFSIRVLADPPTGPHGNRLGEIRIGDFVERFAVRPLQGSHDDMAAAWLVELRRLAAGAAAVGLATSPGWLWVLYRFGDVVVVQQHLTVRDWEGKLSASGVLTRAPPYRSTSEDGERISEWQTTVAAVRAFLDDEQRTTAGL